MYSFQNFQKYHGNTSHALFQKQKSVTKERSLHKCSVFYVVNMQKKDLKTRAKILILLLFLG